MLHDLTVKFLRREFSLFVVPRARDGHPPGPNWKRPKGHPRTTRLHQICTDIGLFSIKARTLAPDRSCAEQTLRSHDYACDDDDDDDDDDDLCTRNKSIPFQLSAVTSTGLRSASTSAGRRLRSVDAAATAPSRRGEAPQTSTAQPRTRSPRRRTPVEAKTTAAAGARRAASASDIARRNTRFRAAAAPTKRVDRAFSTRRRRPLPRRPGRRCAPGTPAGVG